MNEKIIFGNIVTEDSKNSISYLYKFLTRVKKRWTGKSLLKFFIEEFPYRDINYYKTAIELETITVNGKKSTEEFILKETDTIEHIIHYHEPILNDLEIIAVEEDFMVVNKPSGIACHPTGGYNNYTITKYLENNFFKDKNIFKKNELEKQKKELTDLNCIKFDKQRFQKILEIKKEIKDTFKLGCVNRLDVLTSGVLIIAFKNWEKYHKLISTSEVQKKYYAKVNGNFFDEIICDKKIKKDKIHSRVCEETGKNAVTKFKKIKYNGKQSLVECIPITGRSHQIRVHLQFLGFPIVNDPIYGESNEKFVYEKCSHKSDDEVLNFLFAYCDGENNRSYRNKDYFICLHAFEYKFLEKKYTSNLPNWVNEFLE